MVTLGMVSFGWVWESGVGTGGSCNLENEE